MGVSSSRRARVPGVIGRHAKPHGRRVPDPFVIQLVPEEVMSFGASAAMMGMMQTMVSTMIEATMIQVMMSMIQSVCNIAKTGAQDTEEDSKKG
ncbi:hypothetical protein FCJ61_29100 [Burkholderia metallica]|nr:MULTISPECIES: hypothetical protein [Burkholderia]NTZ86939.1 hypothetical protein [Burkholderia metallica]